MEAVNRGEGDAVRFDGRTFKALAGWRAQFDYAAFVRVRTPRHRCSAPWPRWR